VGVLVMAASMALGGCSGSPKYGPYDVTITLDQDLKQGAQWPSLEVDLVGVGEADRPRWSDKSIDAYFSSGDPLRSDAKSHGEAHTMRFSSADPNPKTLSKGDPIWKTWQKKPDMFVIADLRWFTDATDPNGVQRRLVVPLDRKRWKGQKIEIAVRRGGLRYKPGMDPLPPGK
jgi:hypothetical protein